MCFYLQATDDNGNGHSTVVQLKITLNDNNDNPPIFEADNYKALIDEGSSKFEPPLQVHVSVATDMNDSVVTLKCSTYVILLIFTKFSRLAT